MPSTKDRYFARTRPCESCPWRRDVDPYLTRPRAIEISNSARGVSTFTCHKTVDYDVEFDDEGNHNAIGSSGNQHCAGAAIAAFKHGGAPNQLIRIGLSLGTFRIDLDDPDPDDLVLTVDEFIQHHGGEEPDNGLEFCNVVYDNWCDNAPGFAGGGGVILNEDGPMCDRSCPVCGEVCCDSCFSEDGETCKMCAEDSE